MDYTSQNLTPARIRIHDLCSIIIILFVKSLDHEAIRYFSINTSDISGKTKGIATS